MTNTNHPRLLSFALDGWTVLGGRVSVSLSKGVAVLVGRNGAGKSAILEGFDAISSGNIGKFARILRNDSDSFPKILDIEILTPTDRRLQYKCELIPLPIPTDDLNMDDSIDESIEESQFFWNDCCQYVDEPKEVLWTTENGVTTLKSGDETTITVSGNTKGASHFCKKIIS